MLPNPTPFGCPESRRSRSAALNEPAPHRRQSPVWSSYSAGAGLPSCRSAQAHQEEAALWPDADHQFATDGRIGAVLPHALIVDDQRNVLTVHFDHQVIDAGWLRLHTGNIRNLEQ